MKRELLCEDCTILDDFCGELINIVSHVLDEGVGDGHFIEPKLEHKHVVTALIEVLSDAFLVLLDGCGHGLIFH